MFASLDKNEHGAASTALRQYAGRRREADESIDPTHSGDAHGLLFYVMPFVEGESLRARLNRERQLPVDEAVRIAGQVASALDYAHRRALVHRDIKPENILLQEQIHRSRRPVIMTRAPRWARR